MQTRHRIPSVFNLSMVDVLCCALGCVILLWLVKSRDARDKAREAGRTHHRLAEAETRLAGLNKDLQALQSKYSTALALLAEEQRGNRDLSGQLESLKKLKEGTEASLARLTREQAALLKELSALKVESKQDKRDLREKALALADLEKALAALKALSATTQESLRKRGLELADREKALAALRAQKADAEKRLRSAEDLVKALRAEADKVPGLKAQARLLRDKLNMAEGRALALEKDVGDRKEEAAAAGRALEEARRKLLRELEGARAAIDDLRRDKKDLAGQVVRARAAAENRFAGIELTGRRVIFLVDMSGSMDLIDEKTEAPGKWLGVRNTVAKLMRSLPDLEKFQVIIFSEKASYLLGDGNHWLAYDPRTSADRVTRALAAIRPTGGTNMYTAFREAFRFRPAGLDTIYVLSDGLPNMGEGLTADDVRNLRAHEQEEILSKYIRYKLRTDWNRPWSGRRVRINAVGFFFESPDVGAFLWAMARENDGSFVGMSRP